ncbi:MAG: antibiotic biosynthesis monooxygenase [Geodermatophilales bacterium]|jgi:quinol monooxygenase YgiN|nr:antibiotic biosynthesis monooxygenase [Geodermatophilales bacterium]
MHARSTTILGNPSDLDAGITYMRDEGLPAIEQTEGCIGLSMLTDRESGRCIVTTSWADEQAMRAATEDVHPIRFMQALGAQGADIRQWEIAVLHRECPAGDGAGAQVSWARITPNHLTELLDAYRLNLMPRLVELPGFCSLSMMVDRRTGRTVSVTAFDTRQALALVRKHARHLREQFAQAMGAKILEVAEMDLALAHLRAPETV